MANQPVAAVGVYLHQLFKCEIEIVGLAGQDLLAILQALKASGALHAELEVI